MNEFPCYEKESLLDRNFPIKIFAHQENDYLHMHWHNYLELLFFEGAPCTISCSGQFYDAVKGDMVVVNPNEIHYFDPQKESVLHTCILIYPMFFNDIDFEGTVLKNLIPKDKFIEECMNQIIAEEINPSKGSDMLIKAKTYELVAHLVRNYAEESSSRIEYLKKRAKLKKINTILSFIEEHYADNLSTRELADNFFISEAYLCQMFKKELGTSPLSYINTLKIHRAAMLLTTTTDSITTVAMNSGFSNINYFSRLFKKEIGFTPKEYRNRVALSGLF